MVVMVATVAAVAAMAVAVETIAAAARVVAIIAITVNTVVTVAVANKSATAAVARRRANRLLADATVDTLLLRLLLLLPKLPPLLRTAALGRTVSVRSAFAAKLTRAYQRVCFAKLTDALKCQLGETQASKPDLSMGSGFFFALCATRSPRDRAPGLGRRA